MKAAVIFILLCIALFDWGLVLGSSPNSDEDDEKDLSGLLEEDE